MGGRFTIQATENIHKFHLNNILQNKKLKNMKHIHWLNLINGLSKRSDFIRKLITS